MSVPTDSFLRSPFISSEAPTTSGSPKLSPMSIVPTLPLRVSVPVNDPPTVSLDKAKLPPPVASAMIVPLMSPPMVILPIVPVALMVPIMLPPMVTDLIFPFGPRAVIVEVPSKSSPMTSEPISPAMVRVRSITSPLGLNVPISPVVIFTVFMPAVSGATRA